MQKGGGLHGSQLCTFTIDEHLCMHIFTNSNHFQIIAIMTDHKATAFIPGCSYTCYIQKFKIIMNVTYRYHASTYDQ